MVTLTLGAGIHPGNAAQSRTSRNAFTLVQCGPNAKMEEASHGAEACPVGPLGAEPDVTRNPWRFGGVVCGKTAAPANPTRVACHEFQRVTSARHGFWRLR